MDDGENLQDIRNSNRTNSVIYIVKFRLLILFIFVASNEDRFRAEDVSDMKTHITASWVLNSRLIYFLLKINDFFIKEVTQKKMNESRKNQADSIYYA